jgi:hypothetical protein
VHGTVERPSFRREFGASQPRHRRPRPPATVPRPPAARRPPPQQTRPGLQRNSFSYHADMCALPAVCHRRFPCAWPSRSKFAKLRTVQGGGQGGWVGRPGWPLTHPPTARPRAHMGSHRTQTSSDSLLWSLTVRPTLTPVCRIFSSCTQGQGPRLSGSRRQGARADAQGCEAGEEEARDRTGEEAAAVQPPLRERGCWCGQEEGPQHAAARQDGASPRPLRSVLSATAPCPLGDRLSLADTCAGLPFAVLRVKAHAAFLWQRSFRWGSHFALDALAPFRDTSCARRSAALRSLVWNTSLSGALDYL